MKTSVRVCVRKLRVHVVVCHNSRTKCSCESRVLNLSQLCRSSPDCMESGRLYFYYIIVYKLRVIIKVNSAGLGQTRREDGQQTRKGLEMLRLCRECMSRSTGVGKRHVWAPIPRVQWQAKILHMPRQFATLRLGNETSFSSTKEFYDASEREYRSLHVQV
jgi:hypothetical protein